MSVADPLLRLPQHEADAVCFGSGRRPTALLPGSFNPVHSGHWGLAEVASRLLGSAVAFELSLDNVDKPPLSPAEVRSRIRPFAAKADMWLTRAPTFLQKARLFPGTIFVVGADTAERIVAARYYQGDAALRQAFQTFTDLQCSFLVAARADAEGKLQTLDNLAIPPPWRALLRGIDPGVFRIDVSSTQLRVVK
jgi:hypothetical protein